MLCELMHAHVSLVTIWAMNEAIVNALVAAETMTVIDGNTVYALPHDRLIGILRKYNRLAEHN